MPTHNTYGPVVHSHSPSGAAEILVVCEHASCRIPEPFGTLGLPKEALMSHIAWDPGALEVSQGLAQALNAALVTGGVSRLVYDCNRPPEASSAMPERSETQDIPGNTRLSETDKLARIEGIYRPFTAALEQLITQTASLRLLVTVHSFTPVFDGQTRDVQIGILHGSDRRFAHEMLAAPPQTPFAIRLNEPYSATDGVAHTLDLHGASNGLLNVMLEIRNDLIATAQQQAEMTALLAPWIANTLTSIKEKAA